MRPISLTSFTSFAIAVLVLSCGSGDPRPLPPAGGGGGGSGTGGHAAGGGTSGGSGGSSGSGTVSCIAFHQTTNCSASGPLQVGGETLPCDHVVPSGNSGYCECSDAPFIGTDCGHADESCDYVCSIGHW